MSTTLLDHLPMGLRGLLVRVLSQRDPFLLDLLERGVLLSPAQRTILGDVISGAVVSAFGPDWEATPQVLELEELSRHVSTLAPSTPPAISPRERAQRGLPAPFDRYEEYGEARPEGHTPRPLDPQPEPGNGDPLPTTPTRVTGYTEAALQRMAERGISREEIEALVDGYAAIDAERRPGAQDGHGDDAARAR